MNMKKIMTLACMALALFTAGTSMAVDNTGAGGVITYTDSNGSNAVANPPYIGGYVVHTFTNSGTYSNSYEVSADVLVVGGGGAGGAHSGGGGGAGGVIYSNAFPVVAGSNYTVSVGTGGVAKAYNGSFTPTSGGNSSFGSVSVLGGGGGAARDYGPVGATGGSGGGGSSDRGPGNGTAGQGTNGAAGYGSNPYCGGGGGGKGSTGSAGTSGGGGNGGTGAQYTQFAVAGSPAGWFGGGGGGGTLGTVAGGTGGTGGGGGGVMSGIGTSGVANTGGGGGGGGGSSAGGDGGSGIVIVRYPYDTGLLNVSVTAPANNQQFLPGSSVTATVTVAHGTPPYSVEFYTNGVSAWSTNSSLTNLFTIDLGTLADGTYTNYATVTDSVSSNATSANNTFTVAPDTTAPTPNPMTFAVIPEARDASTIVMTASTATDALSPPVEYFFENTTNSDTSGWISSTVWTNSGLTEGVSYGYRVKARDTATTPNETDLSPVFTAIPASPTIFWDSNTTGASQIDGGGTWLDANQWWTGTANATWNNATPNNAIIGNGGTGGTITLGAVTAGTVTLGGFNGTYTLSGGSLAQSGGVTVNSGNVTITSQISGAGGISKDGVGTLTVGGLNTYAGATIIQGGTLIVTPNIGRQFTWDYNSTDPNPLGMSPAAAANLVLNPGATLKFVHGLDTRFFINRGFTINGTQNGDSATLDSSITWTRGICLTGTASPAYGTPNQTRTLILTGTHASVAGVDNQIDANIADNGAGAVSLVKNGVGTWYLTGASTFSGGVTVNAGILRLGNASALGTGTLTMNGGALDSLVGNLVNSRNNVQSWNGDFGFTGSQNLNLGTGTVTLNGTRTVTVNNKILTVGGVIGGSGYGLTKAGAGAMVLNGANTYDGPTTVTAGTLTISNAGAFANTSRIVLSGLSGSSRMEVNVANQSLAKLVTGGGVPLGSFLRYSQAQTAGGTGPGTIYGTVELNLTNVNPDYTLDFGGGSIFQNLVAATYASPITLSGNASIDSSTAVFTLTTGGITASSSGTKTLTLTGGNTGANTISSVIGDGSGMIALTKAGGGSWTLTGANTYTGPTMVSGGTLILSGANGTILNSTVTTPGGTLTLWNANAANNTNRVSDSSAFTLNGGTLNFNNDASANDFSESLGILTLTGGGNTVAIGQAAVGRTNTLTFAGLSRTTGSINFSGTGLTNAVDNRSRITFITPPSLVNGIIGPWATVNGIAYATLDANSNVVAYAGGTIYDVTRQSSGPKAIPDTSTADVRIIEGTGGGAANNTLAAATTTINSLMQSILGGASASTVAIGASETLQVDAINAVSGAGALTLGTAAGTGTLKPKTAGGNLLLVNNGGTMTINSVMADNTSASSITKDGSGTLTIPGSNTYSGGTVINGGTIVIGAADKNAAWGANGGNITFNGTASVDLGLRGGAGVTLNRGLTVSEGANASVYMHYGSATISGAVTGDGTLKLLGDSGNAYLNANTFTGPLQIDRSFTTGSGPMYVYVASLADSANPITFLSNSGGGSRFGLSSAAVAPLVLSNRRIELAASGNLANLSSSYGLTINSDLLVTGAGAKTLGFVGGTITFVGRIADGASAPVTVSRSGGNVYLSGTNTYFGTTENSLNGTLVFQGRQTVSPNTVINMNATYGHAPVLTLLDDGTGTVTLGNNVNIRNQKDDSGWNIYTTFTVGNNNTANGGNNPSSSTTGSTIALGNLSINDAGAGGVAPYTTRGAQITIQGYNGYRLQFANVNLPVVGVNGYNQTFIPTTAPVTITGTVKQINGNTAGNVFPLQLDGTAAGNLISGNIMDADDYPSNANARPLSVIKSSTSDWTLSGTNTYTGTTTISAGTLSINSLANVNGGASALGNPSSVANGTLSLNGVTLQYTGSGHTSDRVVNLSGTTAGAILDASGTGPLVLTSALTATGAGIKTLTLAGTSTATNTLAGAIVDNGGANKTSLIKTNAGTWVLAGSNTYTGTTTLRGGTLTGVTGGSCLGSSLTVTNTPGVTSALGVTVNDNTKQWSCANLAFTTNGLGSQLKFSFAVAPSTSLAPLSVTNSLTFTGAPVVVVNTENVPIGNYPLLVVGGASAPTVVPALDLMGSTLKGSLAWGGTGNKTLFLTVSSKATVITFR